MSEPIRDEEREPGPVVRPYAMTSGRTRSDRGDQLELETLVLTTAEGAAETASLNLEQRTIAQLCQDVLSLAEVAAHLDLPVRVARVLIGDLLDGGLVAVYRPRYAEDDPLNRALLERVLHGLRAI
ncbi:MAG TPA: DUF742 domain-containing protein [Actinomycetes bacterium]|jgi:Protein of unknown function (DUF742)|nr:DUF742 domain-containing protein [Actinomycetes bacterium]